jgi:non-lysosomal glucosylceramidase
MASHGVFLAACGFEFHGPKGHLDFAPRLTPQDFRAPFTAAEGWGTISQKQDDKAQRQRVDVRWGQLRVKTLAFELPAGRRVDRMSVSSAGRPVVATHVQEGSRVIVTLTRETLLGEGQALEVELAS